MALFDGWDWGNIINGGAKILGALESNDANDQARALAQGNQEQNAAETRAARERAVARLTPAIEAGAPATQYFRQVMAQDPTRLTQSQNITLADTTRRANRSIPTALRGNGRAVSASINDTINRTQGRMIDQNTARADTAAGRLASSGDAARSQAANADMNAATALTNINNRGTEDVAGSAVQNAENNSSAMGALAAIFANANKNDGRASEYDPTTGGAMSRNERRV